MAVLFFLQYGEQFSTLSVNSIRTPYPSSERRAYDITPSFANNRNADLYVRSPDARLQNIKGEEDEHKTYCPVNRLVIRATAFCLWGCTRSDRSPVYVSTRRLSCGHRSACRGACSRSARCRIWAAIDSFQLCTTKFQCPAFGSGTIRHVL